MQYGRCAYGAHRRMSRATIARNIAASIRQHREKGIVRKIEEYTQKEETITLVEQLLAA